MKNETITLALVAVMATALIITLQSMGCRPVYRHELDRIEKRIEKLEKRP